MYKEVKCDCNRTLLASDEVKEQVERLRNIRKSSRSKHFEEIFNKYCPKCGKNWTIRIGVNDKKYGIEKKIL